MATTKSITVRKRLDNLLNYIVDTNKTINPDFDRVGDLIDYAADADKTGQRQFVTGINCTPETAYSQIQKVMLLNDKPSPVIGYHFIQSFAPGESDPATVHKIGVELANRLFGERFMCVVATHQNTDCLHNHIALCPTSFIDGGRYHSCKTSYRELQKASDALCRDFGLSVIENPQRGRSKSYGEHKAEREGKPTWRSVIKSDIDECITKARSERQFFENLETLGYEYKMGNDISVRPPGKERFLRLTRNFGDDYTLDAIRIRLSAGTHRHQVLPVPKYRHPDFVPPKKLPAFTRGSIVAQHRRYLYLLGYYQQRGNPSTNARMHYLLRDDIRKLDHYIEDTRLLGHKKIDTAEQLSAFKTKCESDIAILQTERTKLRTEIRFEAGYGNPYTTKDNARYQEINQQLRRRRKEVAQCDRIAERSRSLVERIERIESDEAKKLYSKNENADKKRYANIR
jgi:hypothetical protein